MAFRALTQQHLLMEHRWGNRHEVSQHVRVATHSDVVARGRITSVSMSGAFVEAPLPVVLFSYVRVKFNSAVDGRPTLLEGQVVRKDPTGFALEWHELKPEILDTLLPRPSHRVQVKTPRLVFRRDGVA
jgi:hypothetical protein